MAWQLRFPVDEPVEVVPTHVEGDTGNFFVQLNNSDSSKLDGLMAEIVSFVARNGGDSKVKTLKVGDICLAKYVDEIWYRGKVLGVDKSGFNIFFVDYGNSDFVESNNVMPAAEKFLSLPPQAFECELANVRPIGGHWGTELLVKLEELILEQTIVAQAVALKTNNVLVLSLFQDATMTTLAVEPLILAGYLETTDVALARVQSGPKHSYKCLDLDDLSFEDVYISYCENPNQFYCILLKNSTALQRLMEELEITYREATEDDFPLTTCCQDNPCCAKFSEDDMWYRAIVTSESPSTSGEISVKFVDYGNSENVHISNLMELDERFLELPMQALECTLYGIKPTHGKIEWPQDAKELFQSLISEKHLVTYINKVTNNTAEVFLFDTSEETQDINFGQVLVDSGKAIAVKPLDDYKKGNHTKRRRSSFGIINLVPNCTEAVVVTNAESPSDFYCQLLKHSSDLDKLMSDLGKYYEAIGDHDDTITLPQAGMLCCGKYTEDDGWYRALILVSDIASRQVEVLYVDYGNVEVLAIARIKELKPQFSSLPQQAIPCCLYGVSPSASCWTDQAIEEFQNAVIEKELMIKVISQSESQRYSVSLMETVGDEEYSINKLLVQKGFAMSEGGHPGVSVEADIIDYHPPPLEVGSYIDIEVSHVDNLDQFWCHLMSSNDEMETLMSNLQDYYNANPPKGTGLKTFSKGSPCCARFSEDKLWYRGKILEKMSNNRFKIRFVDFGNCEILTSKSVAVLNPEFLQLPVQCIKCSLENISSSDKRNNKFVHKFLEMVNGEELVCRLDERDVEGKYVVLIINASKGGTINVNEEMSEIIAGAAKLLELAVKNVPRVTEPNIATGEEVPVYVTSVTSSENFYCQLATTSVQLDNVMNNMETFYRPLGANEEAFSNPQVGDVCCAMFTEDDGFYRAVVTKVTSRDIGVRYLDYGNSEELPLSRIKIINASFTELPAQCFNARSSSAGSPAAFEESVVDKELRAMIVSQDESGVYVVRLSDLNGTPLFSTGERSTQQHQGTSNRMPCKVNEAKVPVGDKAHVFITHVTSPDNFFCQFTETTAQLDDLMNEIEQYYRPLGDQDETYSNPQIGEACCAMFTEDEGWYRATVQTKHSGTTFDVCYMDYGNSEIITLSRMKILHQKFTTLPAQGFHACVKLPAGYDTASFKDSVLEKELDARIVKRDGNNVFEVELLSTDGTTLFQSIADKKIVHHVKEANITMRSKEHVYVTSFTSPENFFCQLVKTSTELDELMDRLEELYRPLSDGEECLGNPQVGDTCCAMFTEDDGWYRAVVTKVTGSKVEVRYLDYGNSEELPVSRIKRLLPCFAETNVQGFQASVAGGTSDEAEKIRAAIEGKELIVRVTDRKSTGGYGVEVYEMSGNRLFDSVQQPKKAEVHRTIKDFLGEYNITPGVKLDVCGSHCESPNMFYLHLVKNGKVLDKLMTELNEVYSDLRPKDQALANPVVGMFCAAKFPVDDGWYRAEILRMPSPNEVEVSYIDFGNCDRVESHDIKTLAPAFYKTAVQVVKCRLQGAKENWNPNECETFEILVLEQHLIADVKTVDSKSNTLTIELRDSNGLNILDVLSGKTGATGKSSSQEKLPKLASLPKLQLKDVENVLVESAQSLDSFVCQFSRFNQDLDALADMMYNLYHEGTPPGLVTAPLQVGDVIAALFTEDETWYRASVARLNPDGGVEVSFIDYGNSEVIPKADIRQRVRYLGKDLLRYPAMRGVVCSLSRVSIDGQRFSWNPRAHEAFVLHVVEKEFQARLSSDCEPYKTILEDTSGSIHTWLTREKLVSSRETEPEVVLEDFYELEVEEGALLDVYVTSVVNPEKFYVQQAENGEAIDKVMDDLHVSCTDGSRGAIMNINAGTLCAAQYTADDAWYRARVTKETGPDSCEVAFVDYGNSEVLTKDRIKELDSSFLELPAQAICCSLQMKQPVSMNAETSERFEQITVEKCLKMTVVKVLDGKLLVTMKDEEGSLLNDLFEEKTRENKVQEDSSKSVEIVLLPFPVTGKQTAEVYTSHVTSPGEFYVQFSSTEDELVRLAERATETYDGPESENYKVNNPQQDMFCCARYSEDNAWYRARIIELTNETATVRFVDHGNTDVVNLSSDLRQLSAELSKSPCQSILCSLALGSWSPEQCSSFEAAAMDKPLQATFNEHVNNTWMVTLQDGSTTLNQLLDRQKEKPCVAMPCLYAGDEPSVYIVSVNSPDDVILQLSSHVSELEVLMTDIANNPPQVSLPLAEAECGISCLARFTEDESWYRAKVLECDDGKARVLYIDYGNEEWITGDRLAPISARFSDLPEVCIRCTLDLSTVRGTWDKNSGEKLFEMYGENELRCQIMGSKTDDGFSVKLFCGDEDVLAKVVISGEPCALDNEGSPEIPPNRYELKQLNPGDRKDATCSHIETPQKLWCQFLEDQQTLDDLMNSLDEVYSALGDDEQLVKRFDVGVPCCGQFLEDDGWYRAEILGMEDEGVKVRYIDYGNEEVLPTSRLRSLKPEFLSTPCLAFAYLLKDIQASGDDWSPDAQTLVESFISERSLAVEITSVGQLVVTGMIYESSEDLELSLSDLLVKKSFAVNLSEQAIAKEPDCSNIDTDISYTRIPAKVGDKLNLFYVSADSPLRIWCQLSDSETELLVLMEQLGAFYGNLDKEDWAVEVLVVGAAVCAQFTEDDSWYRAEILETSPAIMVRFVDYGNCEELPLPRVKRLKQEFAVLPKQAIAIALSGVSPQSFEQWSEEKKAAMDELCSEKSYVGEIQGISECVLEASLQDQESHVLLLDELCEAELIVKESEVVAMVPGVSVTGSAPQSELEIYVSDSDSEVAVREIPVLESDFPLRQSDVSVLKSDVPVLKSDVSVSESKVPLSVSDVPMTVSDAPMSVSGVSVLKSDISVSQSKVPVSVSDVSVSESKVPVSGSDVPVSESKVPVSMSDVPVSESDVPVLESDVLVSESDVPVSESESDVPVSESDVPVSESDVPVSESDVPVSESDVPLSESDIPASELDSPVSELESAVTESERTQKSKNKSLEDLVGDKEITEETDPSNEDGTVTELNPEQPSGDDPACAEEPLSDERPSVETKADGAIADSSETENMKRVPSSRNSEEDSDDPQAVCHAIDRLLTEIESRTSEVDRSSSPGTSDRELSELSINEVQDATEDLKTSSNDDAIGITPSEEVGAEADEGFVVSTANTTGLSGDSCVPAGQSNTKGIVDLHSEVSGFGTEQSGEEAGAKEENVPEISTRILYENQSAPESDSATSSSTPFLSPVAELTDESPSDEMSEYLTPSDELETAKEEQAVLSSPESDRADVSDAQRRYVYPEIHLGDIHKVTISHIQSPSSFFCQLSRTEIEFSHLMETIQTTFTEHTEDTLTIDTPTVGTPCCAQSSEDGKWYRALVRNLGSDGHVNVTLVDFGRTLSLPVGRLKAISDELVTSLPLQAVHCSLVDLEPADAEWSADAVTKMTEVCAEKELEGIFRSRHHKVYDIYLRDPENDASDFVNKLLVDLKLAKVTGRDSESEEDIDSNGNSELNRVPKAEGDRNEQLSSNDNILQCESSKEESIETVKVILDSILESVTDQDVEAKVHLKSEIVDVLNEERKGEDVTCCQIQDEGETSDKLLGSFEVCSVETAETPQDGTATTDNGESKDFLEQNGLSQDLCSGNDAQLRESEVVIIESDAEIKKKSENVATSREINTKVESCEVSNEDSEQKNIGICLELDGLEEDIMQIDEIKEDIQDGTVDSGNEMKENYDVPDEYQKYFANEQKEDANKGKKESEGKEQVEYTVPDDGKFGDDAIEEEVETDAKENFNREAQVLKFSSEELDEEYEFDIKVQKECTMSDKISKEDDGERDEDGIEEEIERNAIEDREDEENKCKVKDRKEYNEPNDIFSEGIPDSSQLNEDLSVDAPSKEVTAMMNNLNEFECEHDRPGTENGLAKAEDMVELLGIIDNGVAEDEQEEMVGHISVFDEETRPSDGECEKNGENVVVNSDEQPVPENESVDGEDYQETENLEGECDWRKHNVSGGNAISVGRDEERFLVQVEVRQPSDRMIDDGLRVVGAPDEKKIPADMVEERYKEKEHVKHCEERRTKDGVAECGENGACGSLLSCTAIDNNAMNELSIDNGSPETMSIDKQVSEESSDNGTNDICYSELSEFQDHTSNVNGLFSQAIEHEGLNTQKSFSGCVKEVSEHVEMSIVDKKGEDTFDVDASGSAKQQPGGIAEIQVDELTSDESGTDRQCIEVGGVEQRSVYCSDKSGELVSDMENVLSEKPRLKNDSSETSLEKAILDNLVSDVVLREEFLSGNDEDLDID